MITLAQAEVGKVYTVESVQADIQTKKHLNNLGVVAGKQLSLSIIRIKMVLFYYIIVELR